MNGITFSLVPEADEISPNKKVYRAIVKTNGTVDKEALAKEIVAGYRVRRHGEARGRDQPRLPTVRRRGRRRDDGAVEEDGMGGVEIKRERRFVRSQPFAHQVDRRHRSFRLERHGNGRRRVRPGRRPAAHAENPELRSVRQHMPFQRAFAGCERPEDG